MVGIEAGEPFASLSTLLPHAQVVLQTPLVVIKNLAGHFAINALMQYL
jgi:hypothetical protein